MVSNYYTLRLIAADLDATLRGGEIVEAFCQSKNELLISVATGDSHHTLTVSCEPSMNYLFLRGQTNRAKKNSVDVFKILSGRILHTINIQPYDREIVLSCSGDLRLLLRFYGSKANVLLVDEHNTVIDAFLNPREHRGAVLSAPDIPAAGRVWNKGEFHAQLRAIGSILLPAALKKLLPLMNNVLIHELCHRAGVDSHRVVAEVSDEEILQLFTKAEELASELTSAQRPRIYFENTAPAQFSLVSLEHLRRLNSESFDSVHDAVRVFVGTSRKQKTLLQEKDALLSFLRQGAERAERTLQKMERETDALRRAMQHELMGKVLMANLSELHKGMREATVENVFSEEREVMVIRLEERLTPAQNAERYFEKAKHARLGVQEKLGHQEDVRERWELLQELLDRLTDLHSREQIDEFIDANREQLSRLGFRGVTEGTREQKEEAPFRSFTVAGGFQVWVGKSSENNDLLTLKYARPADLWFHARGSSGSHVVLRIGTGKGEPSRQALEEAASIAAFYSKMKTAKHVPVAMTERKFVRKPRGAPPGTVTIEREKLFFVNPRLPEERESE